MQAMLYKLQIGETILPEISIFIQNYNKETFFLFLNKKEGVFRLEIDDGKKRIEQVIKGSESRFSIDSDSFIIYDMIDTLINLNHDKDIIFNKYFLGKNS
jgi:hypothetical protein